MYKRIGIHLSLFISSYCELKCHILYLTASLYHHYPYLSIPIIYIIINLWKIKILK